MAREDFPAKLFLVIALFLVTICVSEKIGINNAQIRPIVSSLASDELGLSFSFVASQVIVLPRYRCIFSSE